MPQIKVKIKKLRENAIPPKYAHGFEDSGMDVFIAAVSKKINGNFVDSNSGTLNPGEVCLCKTGWAFGIPVGFELQVRPTSGNSLKTKIRIPNAPGTIDAGYRNEVGVIVENIGNEPIELKEGDKVAQLVLTPVYHAKFEAVDELDDSDRGLKGYGSTGTISDVK